MPAYWSAKDERMYLHIVDSCSKGKKKPSKRCKQIAARTVQKQRVKESRASERCLCPTGSTKTKKGSCVSRATGKHTKKRCQAR